VIVSVYLPMLDVCGIEMCLSNYKWILVVQTVLWSVLFHCTNKEQVRKAVVVTLY
jgi:hypothetical protein